MVENFERVIVLGLSIELRQLSEIIIDHNGCVHLPLLGIWNADASILFVSSIELTIDPEASPLRVAHLSVVIDNEGAVASSSRLVNESETTLFDDSSALFSVALEFDNEETNFAGESRESELLVMDLVLGISILFCLLVAGDHTVKIDRGVERLQVLLVVGLGVELEDLDREIWDVFDLELKDDFFLNFECVFVGLLEFQDNLVLDHFVSSRINVFGEIDKTIV